MEELLSGNDGKDEIYTTGAQVFKVTVHSYDNSKLVVRTFEFSSDDERNVFLKKLLKPEHNCNNYFDSSIFVDLTKDLATSSPSSDITEPNSNSPLRIANNNGLSDSKEMQHEDRLERIKQIFPEVEESEILMLLVKYKNDEEEVVEHLLNEADKLEQDKRAFQEQENDYKGFSLETKKQKVQHGFNPMPQIDEVDENGRFSSYLK
eukprot:TRINITY_DN3606_c0_g1_i1.p1 TRINITY_DN3606_c0_g1~~TRINITY_DN3606_c0_g1_i1.p1  ORF type:complete len:206 (-),score=47.74 TRINITY_DN3606_c0_g1_i1:92-709(-)